ncbi:amino acid ABC transporter permease [Ensifer adhaerens]|uniref:amino acid ABC transporter permease n=1 Tax=Ensifer adhaerens TaxID=106592 RepID=UPI001CBDDCE7|nr:amino acid ABC transporter permease [Ensifer adhaerens]MBZ7925028.1 amino acid ABC transporter permease [Ensifer adhaerens]UAX95777.1 amino acid ABC transporter permease [Ensifer adhaerens]UAY04882.1 amino acid ABC transporter permease [Ensifer adhaerens]UAY10314.1 amino acid ABC transporter permease [Ensifer adhaerens]
MDFSVAALSGAFPQLLPAMAINFTIALVAMALALVGGTSLTILRTLGIVWLNGVIAAVISFIRGTPILVQIFLFYYGLPALGLDLSPIEAGILAIAFNSSIFITEIMRGGLSGMDSGPIEAAIALGIKGRVIWRKVILPQLYIRIMPPLVNELTTIVKGTALLSVITVVEVLRTAQQVANSSFRPLETLLAAALILFAVNFVISQSGRILEGRFAARRG